MRQSLFAVLFLVLATSLTGFQASARSTNRQAQVAVDQLEEAYRCASAQYQADITQAEHEKEIGLASPKIDPDHSGERMNEIQAKYLSDLNHAGVTYNLNIGTAEKIFYRRMGCSEYEESPATCLQHR